MSTNNTSSCKKTFFRKFLDTFSLSAYYYNSKTIGALERRASVIKARASELDKLPLPEFKKHIAQWQQEDINFSMASTDKLDHVIAISVSCISRTINIHPYICQIVGVICMYSGKLIEMQTGEGKTVVAAMTASLHAFFGGRVHITTANDYLVMRDCKEMQPFFSLMNITCAFNLNSLTLQEKTLAYKVNVMYSTIDAIGFDYLRDNMVISKSCLIPVKLHTIIVDEADSALLDEASTPLILSDSKDDDIQHFTHFNKVVKQVVKSDDVFIDYTKGKKHAFLSSHGYANIQQYVASSLKKGASLFDAENLQKIFYINACIQAHYVYKLNEDYIVQEGQVMIVSDKTGRVMPGRRWQDGIHQAIEAKENLQVRGTTLSTASITLQSLCKMYKNISGMTGTIMTDAQEIYEIYGIECIAVPTNKPNIRKMLEERLYINAHAKYEAISEEIDIQHKIGRPILVGTQNVKESEKLSRLLTKRNIKHKVLNAKQHAHEAHIISNAGKLNAITIATNMAGRGTDIVLGGKSGTAEHEAVMKLGGLLVLSASHNFIRRIDNQLAGRCGRQGEPGACRFYSSIDDNLLADLQKNRIFMYSLGAHITNEYEPLDFTIAQHIIHSKQIKVEKDNFEHRKYIDQEDAILGRKRKTVYRYRQDLLSGTVHIDKRLEYLFESYINDIDIDADKRDYNDELCIPGNGEKLSKNEMLTRMLSFIKDTKARNVNVENSVMLKCITLQWTDYINMMSTLKQEISLCSFAQKDPIIVFEQRCNEEFSKLLLRYRINSVKSLIKAWQSMSMLKSHIDSINKPIRDDHSSNNRIA